MITNQDVVEDEIEALIVMAELIGYDIQCTSSAFSKTYNLVKGAITYQMQVNFSTKESLDIYMIWIKKMSNGNLLVSSSASPNNDLLFPINVLKMIL